MRRTARASPSGLMQVNDRRRRRQLARFPERAGSRRPPTPPGPRNPLRPPPPPAIGAAPPRRKRGAQTGHRSRQHGAMRARRVAVDASSRWMPPSPERIAAIQTRSAALACVNAGSVSAGSADMRIPSSGNAGPGHSINVATRASTSATSSAGAASTNAARRAFQSSVRTWLQSTTPSVNRPPLASGTVHA